MMKSIFSNICPCSSVSLVVPGVDPQHLKLFLSLCVTNNSDADIFLTDDESFFETPQTSKSNL